MLGKIAAWCLVLSVTGFAAARLDETAGPRGTPELNTKLLQLQETSWRHPDRGLRSDEIAAILPELVQFDAQGRPRAVDYRMLSFLLLDELRRLAERVAELEAAGAPAHPEPIDPLVRITVVRND